MLLASKSFPVAQADLARLSCLTAVVIFVALQLRMLQIVHQSVPDASRRPELLAVMMAATVLSGPQLYILGSASIYHEPILWSAAFAAAFNLVVVRRTFREKGLRSRDLVMLAALAGLAVNTRPSIGVALCVGTILLVAWTVRCRYAPEHDAPQFSRGAVMRFSSTVLPPVAIVGLAAAVAGFTNFERWGNAFAFADFHYYDMRLSAYPNLVEILRKYGEFDVGRIWIGVLYYSTDVPWVLKAAPSFAKFLLARVQAIEGPRSYQRSPTHLP